MEPRTFYDTTELFRNGPRKFHAAWAEVHDGYVNMTPTVGRELAPQAVVPGWQTKVSEPERLLARAARGEEEQSATSKLRRERQAWWVQMWRSPHSPYKLHDVTEEHEDTLEALLDAIPAECFPAANNATIPLHRDARIVCETAALGGRMLLTTNMGTMEHKRVNKWFKMNAPKFGLPARGVVFRTDTALAAELKRPGGLEKGLQAAMLATWTKHERNRDEIVSDCLKRLKQMYDGTGGQLRATARLLHHGLQQHPDPDRIVLDVRRRLPSPAAESDYNHPTHPKRPSATDYGRTKRGQEWTPHPTP